MATGRGRLLQLHCLGLLARRPALGGFCSVPGSAEFRKGPSVRLATGCTTVKHCAHQDQRPETSSTSRPVCLESILGPVLPWRVLYVDRSKGTCRNFYKNGLFEIDAEMSMDSYCSDSLPSEILLKILSYLDAVTLLCIGCVNWRFYHLANDNFIWIRIYSAAFSPKRSNWKVNSVEKTAVSMNLLSVGDKEAGYWKREYITKQITSVKAALARVLQPVNPYLGLPVKIREALRISGLGWVIILREKSGREYVMEHVDLSINDSSITILWFGRDWPRLATLSTLDLCGVMPVFMDQSKTPTKNGPRWHSLIAKYNLSNLAEATMMGCDTLVRLFCLHPGLAVGLWKREEELAFVMAHLHFHQLVERSALGSAAVPYELPPHSPLLDDSPECGLHGYQLHVDMHSGGVFCLCGTFRNLFTKKGYIENEYAKLVVISSKNNAEHVPLIGKVGLSWKTNIFDGCIKTYHVDYVDPEGRVHVELVWIEETEEYFIVSLVLYLSVAKINRWFGTKY